MILVDELFEGGGEELRTKGVWDNWPALEESLRRYPFWADLTFHSPVDHAYDTIDVVGRVNGTYLRSDGTYAALSVGTAAGERTGDPEFCTRIVDLLAEALDGADPAFVRVEHLNFSDIANLETGLRRNLRKSGRDRGVPPDRGAEERWVAAPRPRGRERRLIPANRCDRHQRIPL